MASSEQRSKCLAPSPIEWGVSHHTQCMLHSKNRTNTCLTPAYLPSPWMDLKISRMFAFIFIVNSKSEARNPKLETNSNHQSPNVLNSSVWDLENWDF